MKATIISTYGREYIPSSRTEFGTPYKDGGKWNIYVYIRRFEIEVSAWTFSELEEKLRYVSPLKAAQRVYDALSISDQIIFGDRPANYEEDYIEVIPAPAKRDDTAREIRALRRDLRSMAEAIGEGMTEAAEAAQRPTVPTMPTVQQPQTQAPVQPDPLQQLQMENTQLQQQIAGMSQALQKMTEQLAYMQGQLDAGKPKAEEPPKK